MDSISKETVQEMDPEADQAMEWNNEGNETLPDIFRNPVILNCILEQLPNSKLLELSLVSKFWKKEARIVMKKRGNVMALLENNLFRGCGKVFQAFAANLETLNESMYSGITIRLWPVVDCEGTGALEVERIHESILTGMRGKLKRLSVRLTYSKVCCNNAQGCPNFLLIRLLLRDFIGDLEHLTLKIERIMEPFIEQFLPEGPYPRLKVLKLADFCGDQEEETFGNQIRLLLSRAPNLQEIHTWGRASLRENLMDGREGVVHVYEQYVHNPMQNISENVIPALRLIAMRFVYTAQPELELDRFNEKAQSLLRTCCATTLERLEVERVSLVLLMSYGIQLVNVKELWIRLDYVVLERFEPRILSILSRFDFTYLFPNLNKVDIHMNKGTPNLGELSRDTMDAIIEQANAVQKEPKVPRAGNIKYLKLYQDSIPACAVQFFAHMFPDIQELFVYSRDTHFPVGSAWERWPNLKLIKVNAQRYRRP